MAKREETKGVIAPQKKVTDHNAEVIYMLAASGMNVKEIAKASNCSVERVRRVLKRENAAKAVNDYQLQFYGKDLTKRFKVLANKAINTLDEIVSDKMVSANVRLNAASEILDRSYGKPKQYIEHTDGNIQEFYDKLDQIIDTRKAIPVESRQEIVDTDFIEIKSEKKEEALPNDEIDEYFIKKDKEKVIG